MCRVGGCFMPRELPPPGASRHPPHEDGGGMKTADAVALFAMTVCAPPLPATTRVIASSRSLLAMTSRTIHTFLLLSRNRGERSSLFLIPPTFVGRVAHREHCEGCVGWGAVSCLASYPHPALRATPERASLVSTPQVGGMKSTDADRTLRNDGTHKFIRTSHFSPRQHPQLRDLAAYSAQVLDNESHLKFRGRRECRAHDAPAASRAK